jgi:hypothetical protein
MKFKSLDVRSFLEWRLTHKIKKKEKKDESRSATTNGEIGIENDEGKTNGDPTQVSQQTVYVFSCPEL